MSPLLIGAGVAVAGCFVWLCWEAYRAPLLEDFREMDRRERMRALIDAYVEWERDEEDAHVERLDDWFGLPVLVDTPDTLRKLASL